MSALARRPIRPARTRPSNRRRWTTPSDSGLEEDLERYRFDLVALTLLFRGLSDALRLAGMKEIHRQRHTRAHQDAHRDGHSRPMQRDDLVAYA